MRRASETLAAIPRAVKQHPLKLSGAVCADLLTLVFLSMFGTIYAAQVTTLVGSATASVSSRLNSAADVLPLMQEAGTGEFVTQIILLLALMYASFFVAYTVFQSLSWYLTAKVLHHRLPLYVFVRDFALISLVWLPLVIVVDVIDLLSSIGTRVSGTADSGAGSIILFLLWLILVFLVSVSYASLPNTSVRRALRFTLRRMRDWRWILSYVGIIVVLAGVDLMIGLFNGTAAQIVIGVLILLPLVSMARIYLFRLAHNAR